MENQNYATVMGSGTGSSSAPFLTSMLTQSSTIPNYHSYGSTAPVNGCSAGCYIALTSGSAQGKADGWCPRASSPCLNVSNVGSEMVSNGLTWAAFCEDGCPRGADHFPWIGYTNTWNSCVTSFSSCNGPNIYNSISTTTPIDSQLISYLNSPNPANLIWFTPTDSHNMHDNSVSSGDAYLQQLLVGTGTLSNPAQGSLLSTSLFTNSGSRTLLYLWWDEYDPSPNLEYGSMIKKAFVSTSSNYDEFSSLHTIENNWAVSTLGNDAQAPIMSDMFTVSTPPSFTLTAHDQTVAVMQTFSKNTTLTLSSLSGFSGIVDLTMSSNSSKIVSRLAMTSVSLTGGSQQSITLTVFTSNSTGLGDYLVTVHATSGTLSTSLAIPVDVNIRGDIDGDGIVNIVDISYIAFRYGTTPSSARWNSLADLNHDGVVNTVDISMAELNYYMSQPS